MMNLSKNHKQLAFLAFSVFTLLSLGVAVFPAYQVQEDNSPLPSSSALTEAQARGLKVYISQGCVACHTQQVRNIEMDHVWGKRPSIPADYYYSKQRLDFWRQSPSLLGSERTGPDLTSIGERNPSDTWHFMHLYNPRLVVPESIMPSYSWLFEKKKEAQPDDIVVNVPGTLNPQGLKIIATQEAKDLVAYLLSLKQQELPGVQVDFIASKKKTQEQAPTTTGGEVEVTKSALPDGATLYKSTCAVCHQPNGEGLAGAFPPLKGSPIVNDENPELMIQIIIDGYDARANYATMPPQGSQLTDEEIAAIMNYERSQWGNTAREVKVEEVKAVRAKLAKPDL